MRELVASHLAYFSGYASTLEQVARVQDYLLPSRLIDITWNPFAALYFAAKDHYEMTGEVIVFRIKRRHVKFFDSNAVSRVANLAHLKLAEKNTIDSTLAGDAFTEQAPIDHLLQFIRVKKPHFCTGINPQHLKTVLCVKPKKNNQRLLAQSGAFLIFGLTESLDTAPLADVSVKRILISGRKKIAIVKELDRMEINDSTMFPEIEKAALDIRW